MKYVPAAKHGGSQSSVVRIVIHGTVSPCVEGGAGNVARYFQSKSAGGSAHYIVDPGETVAAVRENVVAYHAPPNTSTIGVELCDPQAGPSSRWDDDNHQRMLQRAAVLVRQIAARWDVPLRRLSVADVRAGKRGICGHVDVSHAFGQTDHSDPGAAFPWDEFMHLLNNAEGEPLAKPVNPTEEAVKDLPLLKLGAGQGKESSLCWDVKTLAGLLYARDFPIPAGVDDTVFGVPMQDALRAFQKEKKLTQDAICGPLSWAALLRVA